MKVAAAPPQTKSWEEQAEVLGKIGDAVLRADVDFYNVPFSRNVVGNPKANPGMRRFSEYHPKSWPHPKPSVIIPRETYGRAHAEIRPIRGSKESLITRFTLDYRGGEVSYLLPKPLRPLKIDCFTALTPPTIAYDRKFNKRNETIVKIGRDGSVRYQNACREKRLATPFFSEAQPPPRTSQGSRPDWMFYFQPVHGTLRARILESYINRKVGALWLWASNPTYGFTEPEYYEKFGIRYNTWPRRLGDLLRFFGPWLDASEREELLQDAPYLNPNTEYLDEKGKRRKIPEDQGELRALNGRRKALGLPPVPRSRGLPVDWTFSDFMKDPERMAATPADRFPKITARLQFKPGTILNIPGIGRVKVGESTDLHFTYRIFPQKVRHEGKLEVRARAEIAVSLTPLDLGPLGLSFFGYRFRAQSIHARKIEWVLPMKSIFSQETRTWSLEPQWKEETLRIEGLRARGASLQAAGGKARVSLGTLGLDAFEFGENPEGRGVKLRGLKAQDFFLEGALGKLLAQSVEISELEVKAKDDFRDIDLTIPRVLSGGKIRLRPKNFPGTQIDIQGKQLLENISFRKNREGVRLDLIIPHLGFHFGGPYIVMEPDSGFIRDGRVRISPRQVRLEGDIDFKIKEIKNLPGTDVLRWKKFEVFPHVEDMQVSGQAVVEYSPDQFRLARRPDSTEPIQAGFRLTDSRFRHLPFDEDFLRAHPEKRVIQTDLEVDQAWVEAEDIREVSYRVVERDGKKWGQLDRLESGPVLLHHIQGGGEIWLPTVLWSWLRGTFPYFGIPLESIPAERRGSLRPRVKRPDPEILLHGLSQDVRDRLWDEELKDYGNFVRIEELSVNADPSRERGSKTRIEDLRVYAHETGHFWQFGALKAPEIILRQYFDEKGKLKFDFSAGNKKIFSHIFLKDPKRGYSRFEVKSVP